MQFYSLDRGSTAVAAHHQDLAGLIEKVGRPGFSDAMFRFAQGWVRANHVTAFAFDSDRNARMVFAENAGAIPVARSLANEYVENYWHFDPAELASKPKCRGGANANTWAVRTSASEISHSLYRDSCYTLVDLDNRLSISSKRGNSRIRLSFYRSAGDDFSDEDVAHILESSSVLLALVARHSDEVSRDTPTEKGFQARLLQLAPLLSRREREVCALVAEGVTSEGIGLRLNVGVNTVKTYRKRAYARLNITSQNELMKLMMR
jgi:LuxR family transcriptional regulator, activator of tox operons